MMITQITAMVKVFKFSTYTEGLEQAVERINSQIAGLRILSGKIVTSQYKKLTVVLDCDRAEGAQPKIHIAKLQDAQDLEIAVQYRPFYFTRSETGVLLLQIEQQEDATDESKKTQRRKSKKSDS